MTENNEDPEPTLESLLQELGLDTTTIERAEQLQLTKQGLGLAVGQIIDQNFQQNRAQQVSQGQTLNAQQPRAPDGQQPGQR